MRALEHEVQLERGDDLCVEGPARVVDLHTLETLAQAAELLDELLEALLRAENAGPGVHVALHLLADGAYALVAALLLQVLAFDAPGLIPEHRVDRIDRKS